MKLLLLPLNIATNCDQNHAKKFNSGTAVVPSQCQTPPTESKK